VVTPQNRLTIHILIRTIMEIRDFSIPNCMQHYKKKIKIKNYIKHTYILQDIGSSIIIVSE